MITLVSKRNLASWNLSMECFTLEVMVVKLTLNLEGISLKESGYTTIKVTTILSGEHVSGSNSLRYTLLLKERQFSL